MLMCRKRSEHRENLTNVGWDELEKSVHGWFTDRRCTVEIHQCYSSYSVHLYTILFQYNSQLISNSVDNNSAIWGVHAFQADMPTPATLIIGSHWYGQLCAFPFVCEVSQPGLPQNQARRMHQHGECKHHTLCKVSLMGQGRSMNESH